MGRLRPLAKFPHPAGETATKGLWPRPGGSLGCSNTKPHL